MTPPQTNDGEPSASPSRRVILPPIGEEDPSDLKTPMDVSAGTTVQASLSGPKDQDWFRIIPDGEQILRVSATGIPGVDISLSLYDKTGKKLQRRVNNTSEGGEETITNFLIREPVLIRVHTSTRRFDENDTAYRFISVLNPPGPEAEREPNGSRKKATLIPLDQPILGYLNNKEDRDIFKTDPKEDAPRFVTLEATAPTRTGIKLQIYRSSKKNAPILTIPKGQSSLFESISMGEAPLFVSVTPESTFDLESTYRLQLRPGPAPTDGALEPNDSTAQAHPLLPDTRLEGVLGWTGDHDWYVLPPRSNGVYRVALDSTSEGSLALSTDRNTGLIEMPKGSSDRFIVLPNLPAYRGKVYVRVSSADNGDEPTPSYGLTARWREGLGEEMEPNDRADGLAEPPLEKGVQRKGFVASSTDIDLFPLHVAEDMPSIVTVRFDAPTETVIRGRLLNKEGEELAATTFIAPDTADTFTHYLEPGPYLVEVRTRATARPGHSPYSVMLLP